MPAWRALMDFHACPIVKGLVPDVGGMIMLGSPTVLINSMMTCRVMDMVVEIPGGPNPVAIGATNVCIGDAGVVVVAPSAPGVPAAPATKPSLKSMPVAAATQARTLVEAAKAGVPFCEKCQRITDGLQPTEESEKRRTDRLQDEQGEFNKTKDTFDFDFQPFVVNKSGGLDVGASSKKASIDQSVTYWCLWAKPGDDLKLPATFDADDLNVVPGFGRPLMAVLNDKSELVLPNTRKVILREFNLSGLKETTEMKANRASASAFYKDLHIELEFRMQAKPKGQPDLFIAGVDKDERHLHDVKHLKSPKDAPIVELPLTQDPFAPPSDEVKKTILLIWVRDMINTGEQGEASSPLWLLPDVDLLTPLIPKNPPAYAVIFISAMAKMPDLPAGHGKSPDPLVHELGHVLGADAGLGLPFY
jgi:hypothetical protein